MMKTESIELSLSLHSNNGADEDGNEPWAPDTQLIVPLQSTQALIHESAAILGARAFLNIAKLQYTVTERSNAADISPTGKLPVLRCGAYVVSELEGIVHLAQAKGIVLSGHLSPVQKADLRACMSLVRNKLGLALLYFGWMDNSVYNNFTRVRIGSPYHFPLKYIIPWSMRKGVVEQLKLLNWAERTIDEVYLEVEACLLALEEYLGDSLYFFGERPTELDALVFGYVFTLLTTPLPNNNQLFNMVKQQPRLTQFCERLEKEYFN